MHIHTKTVNVKLLMSFNDSSLVKEANNLVVSKSCTPSYTICARQRELS